MTERFYQFAGLRFRVRVPEEWMYTAEGDLAAFRTEPGVWDHTLEFEVVRELEKPLGDPVFSDPGMYVCRLGGGQLRYDGPLTDGPEAGHSRICRVGNASRVQILRSTIGAFVPSKLVLRSMEAEHQIVARGGILLHAAFLSWKGRAILFTAPSGTGKTTQAELWRRLRGAELINGDRAAVMLSEQGWLACGIPYPGSSGVCRNEALPLAAIVCIRQSPSSAAGRLTGLRAFRGVWEGCSVNVWNAEDVNACSETVLKLVQQVKIIDLACTMDETAVAALERLLE